MRDVAIQTFGACCTDNWIASLALAMTVDFLFSSSRGRKAVAIQFYKDNPND